MENDQSYLASLKSIETENTVDKVFYRPIGYRIARSLTNTGITPNMITIASIFVGLGGGLCFVHDYNILWALGGILCLILANIMDCVDGQLARLTGIKSEVGRILDGLAGDLWFACIYICFIIRLSHTDPDFLNGYGWILFFGIALCSGISHLIQAAITDYYKTIHLFFISPEKGKEFESIESIKNRLDRMEPGINKILTKAYLIYTTVQEHITPNLQNLLLHLKEKYGNPNNIPEDVRINFRTGSKKVMHTLDWLTFNGRTIPLFCFVLSGYFWLYFIFEIVILNIVLIVSIKRHEAMCAKQEMGI